MKNLRLIALAAIILTSFNLRTAITALAPLVSEIRDDLGVSASLIGVLGMIPTAMFAVAAFALPSLKRKFTTSQLLMFAMLLTAAGQIIRVAGPASLLMVGTVFAMFAIGVTNVLLPIAVREYFPRHVGGMSTTYLVSFQIVQALAPTLAVPISQWATHVGLTGWRVSLGSWALLGLVAAISWIPLLSLQGARVVAAPSKVSLPVWKSSVGVGLGLMFGFTSFATYILMGFMPQMVGDPQLGAVLLGWWSILGLPLNILGPWLVTRFNNCFPMVVIASVMFLIGNGGFCLAPDVAPWLWATLSGLGPLAFPMALTLINVRAETSAGASALSSFGQGLGYTIACFGPLLTGFIVDATGSFRTIFVLFAVATLFVIGGGYFATRQVYVEKLLNR